MRATSRTDTPGVVPPASRIIAFSVLATTMSAFGQTPGVSVFIDPLIAGLSISRAEISFIYSIASLGAAFAMPWARSSTRRPGRAGDGPRLRFGPRRGPARAVAGERVLWLAAGFFGIRFLGQGALNLTARVLDRDPLPCVARTGGRVFRRARSDRPLYHAVVSERADQGFDWWTVWIIGGVMVWLS